MNIPDNTDTRTRSMSPEWRLSGGGSRLPAVCDHSLVGPMRLLTTCALVLIMMNADAKPLDLVRNGVPNARIVLSPGPPPAASMAAGELREHVRLITGAQLPIVRDDVAVDGVRILVGESAATRSLGLRSEDFASQIGRACHDQGDFLLEGDLNQLLQGVPHGSNRDLGPAFAEGTGESLRGSSPRRVYLCCENVGDSPLERLKAAAWVLVSKKGREQSNWSPVKASVDLRCKGLHRVSSVGRIQ